MIYTGEGTHKGCPYVMADDMIYTGEGTHKGCPYVMGDDMIYKGEGLFLGYWLCYTGFFRGENMLSPLSLLAQADLRSSGTSERQPIRRI